MLSHVQFSPESKIENPQSKILLKNQHGVAIAVKSIALLDGFGIGFTDQLQAGEGGYD